ncbi:MAG TPA: thiol peroxidase [Aggregatilineales bacterium]|nr:thiol peroxidase [Aggregatilineales bacterium]
MSYEERENGMIANQQGHTIRGRMLQPGDDAPDFRMEALDNTFKTLADYGNKIKLVSVVPSVPTRVCSMQTHRFNAEASKMDEDVVILTVSADLPMALRRWCGAEGIDRLEMLSTHRDMQFLDDYGVHDLDWRINQRSIFVIDRDNKIIYAEYIPVIGEEVNYEAALDAVREALGK